MARGTTSSDDSYRNSSGAPRSAASWSVLMSTGDWHMPSPQVGKSMSGPMQAPDRRGRVVVPRPSGRLSGPRQRRPWSGDRDHGERGYRSARLEQLTTGQQDLWLLGCHALPPFRPNFLAGLQVMDESSATAWQPPWRGGITPKG